MGSTPIGAALNSFLITVMILLPSIVMKKTINFLYALFFTRDDDLDTLQVLFAAIVIVSLMICWNIIIPTTNPTALRVEGLLTLRWLTGLLVITAVPKWLVPIMVDHVTKFKAFKQSKLTTSDDSVEEPTETPS